MKFAIPFLILASIGDSADYREIGSCTSNFIRSIDATAEIVGEDEDTFHIDVDYDIKLRLGRERGTFSKDVDRYFFMEEFMIDLRENGRYEDENFTVTYLRPDGDCDWVNIDDFDDFDGDVDAKVCFGEPLLGITRANIEGRLSGIRFKACVEME